MYAIRSYYDGIYKKSIIKDYNTYFFAYNMYPSKYFENQIHGKLLTHAIVDKTITIDNGNIVLKFNVRNVIYDLIIRVNKIDVGSMYTMSNTEQTEQNTYNMYLMSYNFV